MALTIELDPYVARREIVSINISIFSMPVEWGKSPNFHGIRRSGRSSFRETFEVQIDLQITPSSRKGINFAHALFLGFTIAGYVQPHFRDMLANAALAALALSRRLIVRLSRVSSSQYFWDARLKHSWIRRMMDTSTVFMD